MNFNQIKFGKPVTYLDGVVNYLKGAMIWGFRSKYKWSQATPDIWGFANPNDIDPEAQVAYNRIIADGGVSDLTRLNYFVVGLKTIYGTLANVPVCYDAHWIGYKLGSGTGATAGQAAAKLYSLTVAGDAVQSTAASQPLLLVHNGASTDNYWYGSGVAGNFVSTPNASANQLFSNFAFETRLTYISGTANAIYSKYNGTTNYAYRLQLSGAGLVELFLSTNGTTATNHPSTVALTQEYLRVSRNATTGDVKFFQSNDGVTYTQLGATINNGITGALFSSTQTVLISALITGNANPFNGKIFYLKLFSDDTFTTISQYFNPATYNASTSQTQWTSSTGEIWTISTGTATSGYKGVLVDRTIVVSDGIDDNLTNSDTTTFRTTIAAVSVNRTGAFYAGILNNNSGAVALSQWMHTTESVNTIEANAIFTSTKYVNNVATSTYTPYRTFIGQIDLAATPNTANGRIIGFLGGNNYLLGNIKTILQTSSNPDATQRTSTYNLLKTLNNL